MLLALGEAFQLTTLGLKHFIEASAGIEKDQAYREDMPDLEAILDTLFQQAKQSESPVMILDSHGDIVVFNQAMLSLHGQTIQTLAKIPTLNLLLAMFELDHSTVRTEYFEKRIIQNIRLVRANSIFNRTDPYFAHLIDYLNHQYPRFIYLWQRRPMKRMSLDSNISHEHRHSQFGNLKVHKFSNSYNLQRWRALCINV